MQFRAQTQVQFNIGLQVSIFQADGSFAAAVWGDVAQPVYGDLYQAPTE
jgi:hypothetical protein